jgi:hypothetical protein
MSGKADDRAKVDEYLQVVQERIVAPIEDTDIRRSCTATLLLLFAGIDGLGYLSHPNSKAGNNARILHFLKHMGGECAVNKKALLGLRNGLVHSGIAAASYLSHTELDADQHIFMDGEFIYVNSMLVFEEFKKAFVRYREELEQDADKMKRAADRLEWCDIGEGSVPPTDDYGPTPPALVEFIREKPRHER